MTDVKAATVFRWKITDPAAPRWSHWHTLDGDCPACCCNGPAVCPDCGGREHQEPAEARTTLDTTHDVLCQGCREDICGEIVETEERAAAETSVIDDLPRLAAASAGLMLAPLAAACTEALKLGVEFDSYLARAATVGVGRERAIEALHEVQGTRAGSTPTAEDLRAALDRLYTLGR